MTAPFELLADWIDIPSVTGTEADYGDAVARALADRGLDVERQQVAPGRFNLLARAEPAELVFCTHLDTVPPWIGPRVERGVVHGRGACDAKGQALAMLAAGDLLRAEGERRIGYLFTVGEEVDSDGARHANRALADGAAPRYTVIGEPTDNRFVRGHKGVFKCRLAARGVAGHSSQDVGPSAVHELVRVLAGLLGDAWGEHPLFGRGSLNVGRVEGGVAQNVVADRAAAEVMLRTVEPPEAVLARLRRHLGEHVDVATSKAYGPVEFAVPEGREAEARVVAFATDAPHLPDWGTKLLYGPGSILDAHTDHEKLTRSSFERAVADHVATARELLARPRSPRPPAADA